MFTNSKLQSAVRVALGVGVGAFAVTAAPSAMAQDGAEELEEIITTGSRIKRADLDSASPVTVIDREAILAQGVTDVGNLIQRMPSMSGTPIGTTTNNGGNGSVQIDLRGMGVNRTVSLINGQRTIDGGDYQTIPSLMIERVEILKDGASAIYGADAVSGVVNIITRTDFEGLNITAQTADWFDTGSGAQQTLGIIAGASSDNGHIMFGAEYIDQEDVFQSDTPWAFLQDSYYIYPGSIAGCENQVAAPYDGTPQGGCYPIGSSRIPEGRLNFFSQGRFMVPNAGDVMVPHDGRTYNYAPVNYIQTPYTRLNIFAEGSFDISENVRFTGALRTNSRRSDQELAPLPFDSNIYPAWSGVYAGSPVLGLSGENFYLRQAVDAYNAANPGAGLVYEPLSNVRRRMVETPRHFSQDISQYNAVLGLEGTYNDLDWDIFFNKGYRSRIDNDLGQFSGAALQNALGPSADLDGDGVPECYGDVNDPATLVPGCVSMNMFGGPGTVTQDMLDYVGVELVDSVVSEQDLWGANVAGSAFELPGGELGWAMGYQYWGQSYKYTPDSGKATGTVTGGTGDGTEGSLYNNAVFGELYAPVFDNGTQSLALKAGARYDDYNLFDGDTTWQFGVEFQAIDSLKLRATAGTAFRAPTISELFAGLGRSAPNYTDPCDPNDFDPAGGTIAPFCPQAAVRTDSQVTSFVGGNIGLEPETADTYTAGVVWTPDFGDGDLSVTLDWWSIEMEGAISSFGVQYILDQCYIAGDASQCALITRRADADYTISGIIDSQVNVAFATGEGVDLDLNYSFDTEMGQFDFAVLWAHMLERTRTPRPGEPVENLEGLHTNVTAEDGGTYAEDKTNFSVHWSRGDFSAGYMAEYISGISADAPFANYTQEIDSFLYHDVVFNYTMNAMGTTELSAGITNVTDEEPPYIDAAFNAKTDPNTYRMFGTGYFLRISHTFE